MNLPEPHVRKLRKLAGDFEYFAPNCLKILTKDGEIKPFVLNKAQQYVHERLEEQLFEENQIRGLILKGRQQGVSTYVEGRAIWRTTGQKGMRAFILTHLAEATDNLFAMTSRYYQHLPPPLKPAASKDSAKELYFDDLDSGFKVSTAGSKGTGRSATFRFFHGSEVAFWPNAGDHVAGALQTVGRDNGSEIIFESTANGMQGWFWDAWQKAEAGIGDFIAIFVPWYWQDEYVAKPPVGWEPEGEEADRMEWYGWGLEQAYWYHLKNIELGGDPGVICPLLKQEYPCTAVEAFQVTGRDTLVSPEVVMRARKHSIADPYGARVMGVDPARFGDDRTSLIDRKGRKAWALKSYSGLRTTEVADRVARRIIEAKEEGDPYQAVFVDEIGLGAGVVDVLVGMGYNDIVVPVNAGAKASNEEKYFNKRVEMWCEMADWMEENADIPDLDSLHSDLMGPGYTHNMRQQRILDSKEKMRKEGIRSPDEAEALGLTFAYPVNPEKGKDLKNLRKNRRSDWRTT